MLVSTVAGSERILVSGVEVVLDVVRMAVNEQFPTLMPILYPDSMTAGPRPCPSLDSMWNAFADLAHSKAPAGYGEKSMYLLVSSTGTRPSVPSELRSAASDHG